MRGFAALVVGLAGASGCALFQGKAATEAYDGEPLEAEAREQSDQRLRVDATVDEADGLSVRVVITVDDNRETATLDYEGEAQTLEWNRVEGGACNCRTFLNESFVAVVTFPTETSEASATVKAKAL